MKRTRTPKGAKKPGDDARPTAGKQGDVPDWGRSTEEWDMLFEWKIPEWKDIETDWTLPAWEPLTHAENEKSHKGKKGR